MKWQDVQAIVSLWWRLVPACWGITLIYLFSAGAWHDTVVIETIELVLMGGSVAVSIISWYRLLMRFPRKVISNAA